MNHTLEYKGYTGTVEYSKRDDCLFGQIAGINDIVTYDGQSVAEIKKNFEETVDWYLEECAASGKQPDKPFSGKVILNLKPELHVKLESQALEAGISLNELLNLKLAAI